MEVDDQNTDGRAEVKNNEDSVNSGEKFTQESLDMDISPTDVAELEEDCQQEKEEFVPDIAEEEELRQFDVLDDLEASDSEGCSNDSIDSDVPDDEIEAMLEESLPEEFKRKLADRKNQVHYEEKEKLIMDEIGHNHFEFLPEGWVKVTHNSGMPLYLHRQSRVCTLSRPYFLGPGSVRKHEVPVSAIPCLQYRRAMKTDEEEKKRMQDVQTSNLPSAKVETIQEHRATQSIDGENLRNYCQALFRFKTIKVLRFKSWSQRRKFAKNRKNRKVERPTLPDNTKLITLPIGLIPRTSSSTIDEDSNKPPKPWTMNPSNKSYVCILHEYVQRVWKTQPTYNFKELENPSTPYSANVSINNIEYGSGFGSSKKQAKANAAKTALEILIPQMRDKIFDNAENNSLNSNLYVQTSKVNTDTDLSFFDEISITDPRVAEFCAKTTEPLPYTILTTYLQRNRDLKDVHIKYSVNTLKHQRNECTMRVGKYENTVICRNKKDGKQRAAQAILQLIHPHINSWGSLLRLYGSGSVKTFREKKQLEQEITSLQGKATINQPNHAILEKLRQEMKKLSEERQAVKPIGKFVSPDLPTGSTSNLESIDL
ncbi:microprocessor complex subunit DGCR8-like [Phymastichus coffea]|uniref:microprocessor complex subunit DGCR8-like n=1 Tax=Phymastichus coffea TaxID=108790 RepID=UPI00273B89C8|nr:microprocessor complex subunit DGCR8-like [Phymastichus coffea]